MVHSQDIRYVHIRVGLPDPSYSHQNVVSTILSISVLKMNCSFHNHIHQNHSHGDNNGHGFSANEIFIIVVKTIDIVNIDIFFIIFFIFLTII